MRAVVAILLVVPGLVHAQYAGTLPVPAIWKKGFDSITEIKARELLGRLAGPGFRGRSPLNGDFELAAGWLASRLESMGVEPGGDDGTFFHRFSMIETTPLPESTVLRTEDGSWSVPFGPNFSVMAAGDMQWKMPPLAFLRAPKGSDWSKLDFSQLKGRWVVLHPDTVDNTDLRRRLNGTDGQPKPEWTSMVVPNGRSADQKVRPVRYQSIKDLPDPRRQPVAAVSLSAQSLLQMASYAKATSFAAGSFARPTLELGDNQFVIDVKVNTDEHPMVNVVGKITGNDPTLKNEAIVIGSHLDHLGPQRRGVYYGADDNASGCTANTLIAQAILANPTKPKRSVYFCFWSSEELGLFGSYAFVQRPTIELKNIAAYINMDMVGRNENDPRFGEKPEANARSIYPSGVYFNSPDFLKVLFDQNQFVGLVLKPDVEDRIMRSDSGSFAWKEIPTVKVFSGDHEDYHQATDTPEKVNYEKLTNVAKWLYLTTQSLASNVARPKWQPAPFKPKPWSVSDR